MKRGTLLLALLGILVLVLATGPDLWAAPGQSPERQTVPTRTPKPEPTDKPDEPDEPPEPTSPPPTDQPASTPTVLPTPPIVMTPIVEASEPFLPEAGGQSMRLHLGMAMIIIAGLLVVAAIGRRA